MPPRRGTPLGADVRGALCYPSDIPGEGDHHRVRDFVVIPRLGTAMLTVMRSVVEALASALSRELAPVRVNAVTPRASWTPRGSIPPTGRIGTCSSGTDPPSCSGDAWVQAVLSRAHASRRKSIALRLPRLFCLRARRDETARTARTPEPPRARVDTLRPRLPRRPARRPMPRRTSAASTVSHPSGRWVDP